MHATLKSNSAIMNKFIILLIGVLVVSTLASARGVSNQVNEDSQISDSNPTCDNCSRLEDRPDCIGKQCCEGTCCVDWRGWGWFGKCACCDSDGKVIEKTT